MDQWSYYNDLAGGIGCRPSLLRILFTDPVLFWYLFKRYSFERCKSCYS